MRHLIRSSLLGSSLLAIVAASAAPALAEDIAIAIHVDPSHEMFRVGERLKDNIETQSDGQYTVTLLGLEVGGERDHLEGASIGEYQIALGGSVPMTLYAPEYAASDLPFVFDSSAEAAAVYEGESGEKIQEALAANANLHLLGISVRNPRNLTANMAVETPEDIQGVPLRVPEIEPWVRIWSEIGALPSPIAFPELYTSLQTGVVQMQENPVDNILSAKFYEVQSHLIKTQHVHSFFHWLMNDDFYQGLSDEDRDMIQAAVDEAIAWGDEQVVSKEAGITEELVAKGMTVVEPDVAAFRQKAAPAIREIAEGFAPEIKAYVLDQIE